MDEDLHKAQGGRGSKTPLCAVKASGQAPQTLSASVWKPPLHIRSGSTPTLGLRTRNVPCTLTQS